METKYDITLLNPGVKKKRVKKLMLKYISDIAKVEKYLNMLEPNRIILNLSLKEAIEIHVKFQRAGASVIYMECDVLTMRDDKIKELFND